MKIEVDRSLCAAMGMCEEIAPEYFVIGDEGTMEVLREDIADADEERLHEAVARCPRQALTVT